MSSFICSPKHFNSIEKFLTEKQKGNDQLYCLRILAKTENKWATGKEITAFMDTLRELSVLCVTLQYKHHYEGILDKEITQQRECLLNKKFATVFLTEIAAFKALQCLNYQIEIGHLKDLRELSADEELAMKLLDELISEIATNIARKLPAYDKAPWSIG